MRAIIFDLDGTLWDTVEQTWISANEIVNKYDFLKPITKETIIESMGTSIEECAKIYMPYLDRDIRVKILMEMLEHNAKNLEMYGGNVYANLEETLEYLNKNYILGIVSNCGPGYIESFLYTSGLEKYFTDYLAAGELKMNKGNTIVRFMKRNGIKKAIYVGDTIRDLQASTKAKIPFIHAKYGFDKNLEVPYAINSIQELPLLLHQLSNL